jgi:uncharacterized membrane protein YobD (UPF0266 family)
MIINMFIDFNRGHTFINKNLMKRTYIDSTIFIHRIAAVRRSLYVDIDFGSSPEEITYFLFLRNLKNFDSKKIDR